MKFSTSMAAAAFVLCAGMASASTVVTFDLRADRHTPEYGYQGNAFSLTEGDLTAEFSARYFNPVHMSDNIITGGTVGEGTIGRWEGGAGVKNAYTDNSHMVDGSGYKDFIQIGFSRDVIMHEVKFSYFDAYDKEKSCSLSWTYPYIQCDYVVVDDDDFRWMYDSNYDDEIGVGDWISSNIDQNPFSAFGGVSSNLFGFGAFEHNDDWKLKKVTVKYHETNVVPLPAAGWLLLAGIGGLAAYGRRKRAA